MPRRPERGTATQAQWAQGCSDDREEECEDEGACIQSQPHDEDSDREPELDALDRIDQDSWASFNHDDEHSLGAAEIHHDQRRWSQGHGSRELDHDKRCGLRDNTMGCYERTDRLRRETEAMLRRKRLIRQDVDELRIIVPGIAEFRGVRL